VGQLIAVAATYNFVRLSRAERMIGVQILHRRHAKASPLSSATMSFARNADCPLCKPRLRSR
jgi:hypothetical protein